MASVTEESASSPKPRKRKTEAVSEEMIIAVCQYFLEGKKPSEITSLIEKDYKKKITREDPYKFLRMAAANNLLKLLAPGRDVVTKKFHEKYPWLHQVEVVNSKSLDHVAYRAAMMLYHQIRALHREPHFKNEIHIGFTGGFTTRKVTEQLAQLLREPTDELPETLYFHILVGGFDLKNPLTDPNTFLTYFMHPEIQSQCETKFLSLHAPAVMHSDQMTEFLNLPDIAEAQKKVGEVDIILTSMGSFKDAHSQLKLYYEKSNPQILLDLKKEGCVGDMLWLPVGAKGPMPISRFKIQPMTLMTLEAIPEFIRRGTKVLLVGGPCGLCKTSKEDILSKILTVETKLITHLVVDSETARKILKNP